MSNDKADLLYGAPAIATYLGMTAAQVYHLHAQGVIPTFKIGKKVAAKRTAVAQWIEQLAAQGGKAHG